MTNIAQSGADKKAWVLAFVKSAVFNIVENWDAYNEVRRLFGGFYTKF